MTRVAVASRSFSRHPVLREELLARYSSVTFNDSGTSLAGAALLSFLEGHDKAIIALEPIGREILAALPRLRVISKYGVGFDAIDLDAMREKGVRLGWTGGVNRRAVAELVIAFAVLMLRHLSESNADARKGIWRQPRGRQLSGRTVGIVGCGHVGKEVSLLLQPFGCRVLAYDIKSFPAFYSRHNITPVPLDVLLRESEIVTLHVPLNTSTRGILDAAKLRSMKPGTILINAARGGLVDELALKKMLTGGHLAGAAFDVFATEPPQDLELLRLPNFFVTPHLGGSTEEAILAMGRAAIRGLDDNRIPEPGVCPEGYG